MRFHSLALAFLGSLAIAVPMAAQTTLTDVLEDPSIQLSRPADRARVVAQMGAIESARRQNARNRAALRGLPLRTELPSGRVQEIADFDGDRPLYLTTDNVNAAISTGANLLRTSPYSLSGAGVTIGLWDGGSGRSTHQEFDTRLTVMDGAVSIDHATHVGGTLIASGVSASARGMASSAVVDSYDWNSDTTEMTSRGATYAGEPGKIYLSNHSYNYVGGWNYVNSGSPTRVWEWYGAGTSSTSIEADFGVYNTYARDNDALCFNAPYYLVFRSAGNDRTDNPSAGQVVALSPGSTSVVSYDPAVHPGGDGNYRGGFDTIGYNAISKNVITIGSAADAVTGSTRDVSKAVVSSFSSWGPTDDGRIKPDVVANGENLYSSLNGSNSSYGTYSGTSMATPNAVGSASLLIQQFGNLFPGQAMRSSTLKGLLIHTADDRGNVGPDYKYGWGMVNVQAAADLISDHFSFPAKQRFTENQVTSSTVTRTLSFVWDGVTPIWATLCWTDPAGTATSTSDFRTSRLVNNLNLKIIAPNGTEFLPYVMPFVGTWSQASMDSAATTGVNNTDNVEQVRIATPPAAGTYQAVVSYTGTLTNSSQNYSLLVSGSSTEVAPPPPLSLASVSPNSGLAGAVVTLDLSGTSLSAGTTVKLTRSGQSDIAATGVQLIGSVLRCQVNLAGAAAGAWNVVATNANAETSTLTAAFTVVGAIWSQNFDGAVTGWASDITTGTNSWALVTTQSQSPTTSYFAAGPATKSTTNLTSPTIPVPAGATNLQLKFWHSYNLQSTKDAGKLEFSIDNGAWFDVLASGSGAAFASNGYNATISSRGNSANLNQFSGQSAWSGNSNGFVETIVNLTDTAKYAGKNLRIRWRIATDSSTSSSGWYVDSIALLGGGDLSNQAPVINTAATTSSSETVTDPDSTVYQVVRSTSTNLSVAATDDAGESALIYTWSVTSGPAQLAFFTANSSNAAKATTVNFEGTGDYQITVSVRDSQGLASTSAVNVRVLQTASGLIVSPAATTVSVGAARSFSAALLDQFSVAMVTQPSSFVWSANAGGSISSSGLFTASTAGGPYVIGATSSGFSNSASVTVTPLSATVTLGNLSQTYDGSPKIISVTTNPPGLAVAITYNGSAAAASNPGSYAVEANITDPNYQGSASGTLLVGKATATVALGSLLASYDGSAKSASATTSPSGLTVDFAYDGSETAPTNAGTYAVVGMIRSDNYTGSASGSLVIGKANATVTLGSLSAIYDGSAKSVSATTSPGGLTVDFTYDSSETAPTNAGTYAVVGTIRSDNYVGSASDSLVIGKATATVVVTELSQTYDGSPKTVTATTTPSGLSVSITYGGLSTAPTEIGYYEVVATVSAANYAGSGAGTLVISAPKGWLAWCNEHFSAADQAAGLAAENADPDFDDWKNLAEYALGTDPRRFNPPLVATKDSTSFSLTFTRPANLLDVTYGAESSQNLSTWSPVPLELLQTGDIETLRARVLINSGNPLLRFLRLRFVRPDP